jgi:hypothetical protein
MAQQPPVPEANKSPYPIEEPPHHIGDVYFDDAQDDDDRAQQDGFSLSGLLDDFGLDTRTAIGIGAAVGLGALAGISALLFSSRRGRSKSAPRAASRRSSSTSSARSASTRKPRSTKAASAKSSTKPAARKRGASRSTAKA